MDFFQIKGSTMGSKRYLLRKNRHFCIFKIMKKKFEIMDKSWNFILIRMWQP